MKDNFQIIIAFILLGAIFWVYSLDRPQNGIADRLKTKKIEESTSSYRIDAEHPVGNRLGVDKVSEFVKSYVEDFKNMTARELPQAQEIGITAPFTLDIRQEFYETSEFYSYVLYISEYTGGAHGMSFVRTFVFNRSSGKQVSLSEALSEMSRSEFIKNLKNKLSKRGKNIGISPERINELSIDSINSFYVADSNIVVLFSQYEIAPGAAGTITVKIPRP